MNRLFLRIRNVLRNTIRRKQLDGDLSDELDSFVDLLTDEKVKSGMKWDDARRAARVKLGGVEQVKQEVRSSRIGFDLETLLYDVRYGFRSLLRKPGFTAT